MSTLTFTISGDVDVLVTVIDNGDGTLTFDFEVLSTNGLTGDITGIAFDLADDSIVDGLSADGADITTEVYEADGVTKISGGVNFNGEVVKEMGEFDAGVAIGDSGLKLLDAQSTTFTLSHPDYDLTLADVAEMDFAIRLQSVGEIDGDRNDSLKLSGTAPSYEDPGTPLVANDDFLTVFSNEAGGDIEFLDGGSLSVLDNDVNADGVQATTLTSVTGDPILTDLVVSGDNGGTLTIYADGTVDFDAGTDFETLSAGETVTTNFYYGVDGGDTAMISVNVVGDFGGVLG